MRRLRLFICLLTLTIWPGLSLAAGAGPDAHSKIENIVVPPLLITIAPPPYPFDLRRRGIEGFVRLSATIKPDGSTTNIRVVDGFNTKLFQAAAIKAFAKAKFKPATEDGRPVSWNDQEINITFEIDNFWIFALSKPVAKIYVKVNRLLKKKDYGGARKLIEFALAHRVRTLTEYGTIEERLYWTEIGAKRIQAALKAIQRAVWALSVPHQNRVVAAYGSSLEEQFTFLVTLHRYVEAERVLKTLNRAPWYKQNAEFKSYVAQLQAAKNSEQPIVVHATIEDGKWAYWPLRRTITVTALTGHIDRLRARCSRKGAVIGFQADVEWTFPAAWGKCNLEFYGSDGTRFDVVEFREPNLATKSSRLH